MQIEIMNFIEGAREARGLTVVIDVFRAFSTACYVFNNGAERIIPVGDIELAFRLKEQQPDIILIGEINERKVDGFDFDNSPSHIMNHDFSGRTIILRTSAGTQGLVNAVHADEIITGSFVNAGAVIQYIRKTKPRILSLVCMGYSGIKPIEEDTFCAEYIRDKITGQPVDFDRMVDTIRKTSALRFFDPSNAGHSPPEDVDLCLLLDRFSFVLKATRRDDDLVELNKIIR